PVAGRSGTSIRSALLANDELCSSGALVDFAPTAANPDVSPQYNKTVRATHLSRPGRCGSCQPPDLICHYLPLPNHAEPFVLPKRLDLQVRSRGWNCGEAGVVECEALIAKLGGREEIMCHIEPARRHDTVGPGVKIRRTKLEIAAHLEIR